MGIFREWIQNVVLFLLFMSMINQIIPDEKYRKYVRLTMGLILILVLLGPLSRLMKADEKIFQDYIRENIRLSAEDAKNGGRMFYETDYFNESYKKIIYEEIKQYFKGSGMDVRKCEVSVNENVSDENFGEIYEIVVIVVPKASDGPVPEEKIETWRRDLMMQFGINDDALKLEIWT